MKGMKLLSATISFSLLRLLLLLSATIPAYYAINWGIDWGRRLSGVQLLLIDAAFGYSGLVIFIIFIEGTRKLLNYVVGAAQVAVATNILAGREIKGNQILFGMTAVMERFGGVLGMFVADSVTRKVVGKLTNWFMEHSNFISDDWKNSKISGFFRQVAVNFIYHVDEVALGYLFLNKEVSTGTGLWKGIMLYFKQWKEVAKASFFTTMWITATVWITHLAVIVAGVYFLFTESWQFSLNFWISCVVVSNLLRITILDPYVVLAMLAGFHENLNLEEEDSEEEYKLDLQSSLLIDSDKRNQLVDSVSSLILEKLTPFDNPLLGKLKRRKQEETVADATSDAGA